MIASISKVGEVWKASKTHKEAFYYIFLSFLREYKKEALLKYYSGNL